MIKKEMIYRNPLVKLGYDNEDILSTGGFGAVLAYAGVGKTALLVQLALNMMLREHSVLHVSLNDAVSKVDLWYQEIFHDIAEKFGIAEVNEYWDKIQPYRFIMTFKVEGFSAPKLEERLTDLMEQNIFKPHTVIIDGFRFDEAGRGQLVQLKELAGKYSMGLWFTVHTHRHEPPQENGLPLSFLHIADLFEVIVQLATKGDEVYITSVKGQPKNSAQNDLLLDPATMLIKESQ
ncbi:MAG TPA: AAA family ATPase [Smithella sp.]|nr:AAA family ATPase [Smithella sp.]HNQ65081.1 AAA family ATPase [Smithella sp.]HOE33017.1 AAA family ATPase [Smithella sp.]HOS13133.1 AAA family ATPase [Smithella sp.]HPC08393.1 AAA family ATPase [Smithella sp.]